MQYCIMKGTACKHSEKVNYEEKNIKFGVMFDFGIIKMIILILVLLTVTYTADRICTYGII